MRRASGGWVAPRRPAQPSPSSSTASRWKTSRQAATRRYSSGIRRSWPEIRRRAEAKERDAADAGGDDAAEADEPEPAAAQHPLAAGEKHRARSAHGGHHGRVAIDQVRELVADDGLELGGREQVEQSGFNGQARALAR